MEFVQDSVTIHGIKKCLSEKYPEIPTLKAFYKYFYGKKSKKARKNFCCSLAAYSLVTYLLQIKDRHNENILLNRRTGHILHIDFGFFLSNAPGIMCTLLSHLTELFLGGNVAFEKPIPFKLLRDYIEVLGGQRSNVFRQFRTLFYRGYKACRKHKDKILILIKMIYSSQGEMPCF